MDIKQIIKLLQELPEDAGLAYPENWDSSPEVIQWQKDILVALKETVKILKSKNDHVGELKLNGKEYRVIE